MLIHPYTPIWADHFSQISALLSAEAGEHLLAIHHIGSTAVPGLAAKPIIDIDMEYPPETALEPIINAMERLGYYHNGDQGIPNREVFKRRPTQTPHPVLDTIPHHLYACPSNSTELDRHLRFRDRLRSDDETRIAYEQIKREIADLASQDRKAYATIKEQRARAFVVAALKHEG